DAERNGGAPSSPILIASHVEPQITQSIANAAPYVSRGVTPRLRGAWLKLCTRCARVEHFHRVRSRCVEHFHSPPAASSKYDERLELSHMGAVALSKSDLFPSLKGWDALRDYDLEATTLWDFPAQSPGPVEFGDHHFNGVTPAGIVTNLVRRYTHPGDLVVDALAGSGTTLDVAWALGRRVL